MITAAELGELLEHVTLDAFTLPVRGEVQRFVVGLTHNAERNLQLLVDQVNLYATQFELINVGGRTSPMSGEVVVDVGTSTDSYERAVLLGIAYNQQCIWDSLKEKEIRLK